MLVLGFVKILFFIRIYNDYGFLVEMVVNTISELVPFLYAFLISIFFFAILFSVLDTDIDKNIKQVQGPCFNYFGL